MESSRSFFLLMIAVLISAFSITAIGFRIKLGISSLLFCLFCGISFFFGPIYFWVNSKTYTFYSGLQTVKEFNFSTVEFIDPITDIFIIWIGSMIPPGFLSCLLRHKTRFGLAGWNCIKDFLSFLKKQSNINNSNFHHPNSQHTLLLLLVFFVLIPMMITMFYLQVGIVGVQTKGLPFHFSGAFYYFRKFILPSLIVYLYVKSNRDWKTFITVWLLTVVVGVTSTSRILILFLGSISILIDFLEGRKIRPLLSFVFLIMFVQFVSDARGFLYRDIGKNGPRLLGVGQEVIKETRAQSLFFMVPNTVGGIVNRLNSIQDLILAEQQSLVSPNDRLKRFMLGKAPVIDNMIHQVYGIKEEGEALALGVNFSLVNSLVVLSLKNRMLLAISGFCLGIVLALTDFYFSIPLENSFFKSLRFPVAFYSALALFWGERTFILGLGLYGLLVILDRLSRKRLRIN